MATRTTIRFAWLPTFTDDRESFFDLTWLAPVRVIERFADATSRPELYDEPLFFPEPRWLVVRRERV